LASTGAVGMKIAACFTSGSLPRLHPSSCAIRAWDEPRLQPSALASTPSIVCVSAGSPPAATVAQTERNSTGAARPPAVREMPVNRAARAPQAQRRARPPGQGAESAGCSDGCTGSEIIRPVQAVKLERVIRHAVAAKSHFHAIAPAGPSVIECNRLRPGYADYGADAPTTP